MQKLWFRTKKYGWGWTPASWQGWLVLAGYVIFNIWIFGKIDQTSHSASDTLRPFFIEVAVSTLVLLGICAKTGEKPRWRWGK